MSIIGTVDSVWRYPVKSMRGEEPEELFLGYAGVYGDRLFAFTAADGPAIFPYLTGRTRADMLLYSPRFRDATNAAKPPNLADVERAAPGLTPLYADAAALAVDVETPAGDVLAVDDPRLLGMLGDPATLSLIRSDRALTDCRPVSLFSLQTAKALAGEAGVAVDKRRFRANIYADLGAGADGFAEDGLIGRRLRIGARAVLAVLDRDPRCKMITLDPDTAQETPVLLERVVRGHEGKAGVYGAVLVEGLVRRGDTIELLD
jgi:hypothetical protein